MTDRSHLGPFPTLNAMWAALWVEELIRQGVGLFVVCPGSRSTPLALALADNPRAEVLVHWDERAAAFLALGWGRATGRPAAVVTTSGTAVANLLPAAAEADAAGVPLLLLTADRPVELRETGANQTLRQPTLLAGVTRWTFDVAAPSAEVDPAFVLTTAGQAVYRTESPAGPVHLNLAFREPLAPPADAAATLALPPHVGEWADGRSVDRWATAPDPYTALPVPPTKSRPSYAEHLLRATLDTPRGLIVLGQTDGLDGHVGGLDLAEHLGWPVWADALSGARFAAPADGFARVTHGDLVLAEPARDAALRPDVVLYLGARAMSKRLQTAIREWGSRLIVVHPSADRLDPDHRVTDRLQADPGWVASVLAETLPARDSGPWLAAWQAADAAVGAVLDREIAASGLSEPFVARAVTRLAPDGWALVAAASMPVRDLDAFGVADGPRLRVTANRGASGIDGTVATAAGVARGHGTPAVLLTGDLALLHDLTSLALLRITPDGGPDGGPPVIVVVINNDGGGIFHQLPVAATAPPPAFERFFGTPHGLGFQAAAAFAGLPYACPDTADGFEAAFADAVGSGASAVIEVRTDRAEQTALRRAIRQAVQDA